MIQCVSCGKDVKLKLCCIDERLADIVMLNCWIFIKILIKILILKASSMFFVMVNISEKQPIENERIFPRVKENRINLTQTLCSFVNRFFLKRQMNRVYFYVGLSNIFKTKLSNKIPWLVNPYFQEQYDSRNVKYLSWNDLLFFLCYCLKFPCECNILNFTKYESIW